MECPLDYIPERLHTNDKPILEKFIIGEKLYYRCKVGECAKPYDKIPLYDISHNRNFFNEDQFPSDDVLFNIIEGDDRERYSDLDITILTINKLDNNITFRKELISNDDGNLKAIIELKHDPKPCMYPHSVFEVSINDVIVNRDNKNNILQKRNQTYKNLRSDIRQELTSILQSKKLDDSIDTEIINEP